ncbi:alcohol dehydrogenase catalytic domain-containing protein [Arthrobacter sp. APC 3897]|uniref:zinc-binding dehydrogenase n=1 Tax=Arthrobacter sp. APC 3897 TaxID=3035204 RepID=UPI0025B565BF|nr:zinc-binding dehydrogenase [Arthrobacter sp. APC 3897]MDN3480648.1 alcohol dehydrogenase catalytic domain-containing protein [Arthrobacter sp. APC 3897]
MIESRAAVLRNPGSPLEIETVTFADPGPSDVVVRIVAASICHSDVHNIASGAPHLPMILGHEAAGVVEQIGSAVTDLHLGQKVGLSFVPSCGSCRACLRGLRVACSRGSGIGSDGRALDGTFKARSTAGEKVGQMVRLGAWSERTVVHRDSVVAVHPSTDMRIAALMSCGFVTGAGSVINILPTKPGDNVLVVGTGGVGIAAIQGAKVAGASRVIAVDVSEEKLAVAKSFGATHAFNARDEGWVDAVVELTDGFGVDKVVNCVGKLSDENVAEVLGAVMEGGVAVLVGAGQANLDLSAMGRKTVVRTLYGSYDPKGDQALFLEMHKNGLFEIEEMISATYSLESINEAIADLKNGKNIRGVIEFEVGHQG